MDELSDLEHLIPRHELADTAPARLRLRSAMVHERRRVRRDWFFVRAVLVGTVMFGVWSIAPASPTGDEVPLIGLAEATAQLGAPEILPGAEWYVREERAQWISLSDQTAESPNDVRVVVNTIAETWVDVGASTVRQRTVSQIGSLSPADREALARVEEGDRLPIGRFETDPVEITYPGVHPMWSGGADAVLAELTARAGESGDVRLDRLAVLKAASVMIQLHGSDPVKRSILLLTIARIAGIDVDLDQGLLSVRYQYVNGDVAQEVRYDFDRATGALVGESIATLATPTAPGIVLSQSRYEARLAIDETAGG